MKRQKLLYVYILKCADDSYYTGITNNPEKRLLQHNKGIDIESYTFPRRPVEMVYCEYNTDYRVSYIVRGREQKKEGSADQFKMG